MEDDKKEHAGGLVNRNSLQTILHNDFVISKDSVNELFNVKLNPEIVDSLKGEIVINPALPLVKENFKKLLESLTNKDKEVH